MPRRRRDDVDLCGEGAIGFGLRWRDAGFGFDPERHRYRRCIDTRLHRDRDRFTDRLVRKFDLPVAGWRGPAA